MGTTREVEAVDEAFRRYMRIDVWRQERVNSDIGRSLEPEFISKARIYRLKQQSDAIKRMPDYSEMEAERQDLMKTNNGWRKNNLNMSYSDNLAVMYFNYFGHGFPTPKYPDGTLWCSEPTQGWVCPKCYVDHRESLEDMDDYCCGRDGVKCGRLTPIGEMRKAGILRKELD